MPFPCSGEIHKEKRYKVSSLWGIRSKIEGTELPRSHHTPRVASTPTVMYPTTPLA